MKINNIIMVVTLVITLGFWTENVWAAENTSKDVSEDGSGTLDIASTELQEKENIAIQKYNMLLKTWAYDSNLISDTNAKFPIFYGGAYINEVKELVILVTDMRPEIEIYFSNIINLDNTKFEKVEYSYERLLEEQEKIQKKVFTTSTENVGWSINNVNLEYIQGVGLSLRENSVVVYLDTPKDVLDTKIVTDSIEKSITDFEHVILKARGGFETISAMQSGEKIYNIRGNTIHSRSAGFWARKNNGDIGIVTAPHDTLSRGETIYFEDDKVFGVAETPYFSGSLDAVFIKRTGSGISISNKPVGWSFLLTSNAYCTLPEGASVYTNGYASGIDIGSVEDVSFSMKVIGSSSTARLTDLVLTSVNSTAGDSGGLVAGAGNTSSRYVAGIITAKSILPYGMAYVKMGNIITTLGVQVY